jgi:hypothetical protein
MDCSLAAAIFLMKNSVRDVAGIKSGAKVQKARTQLPESLELSKT